jgi:hypothetical protein
MTMLIMAIPVLFGLFLISLCIVPATWIWAKVTDQDYHFLCDQSEILYRLNQIGKYSYLILACILASFLFLYVWTI